MLLSVVADVHGNVDALARVADSAERLVILGDLLDYVDYEDPARGILGEMFGASRVAVFVGLRLRGLFPELRRYNAVLWNSIPDAAEVLAEIVRQRYRRILEIVPPDTIVTLGNVDVPARWNEVAGETMPYQDGTAIDVDGVRLGFVAGGAYRPIPARAMGGAANAHPWQPLMRQQSDYRAVVESLPPCDVLCSHIPHDNALLRYDTVPGRPEMAGPGLAEYIDRVAPAFALSGHVHQPLAHRVRRGRTECINVGHFRALEQPFLLDTDLVRSSRPASTAAGR